jgi:hypothetical protein
MGQTRQIHGGMPVGVYEIERPVGQFEEIRENGPSDRPVSVGGANEGYRLGIQHFSYIAHASLFL